MKNSPNLQTVTAINTHPGAPGWSLDAYGRRSRLRTIQQSIRLFLLTALALTIAAYFTLGRVQVSGDSMEPSFKSGQKLTFLKNFGSAFPINVGDVIIVRPNLAIENRDEEIIKRVVFVQNAEGTLPNPKMIPTINGPVPTNMLFGGRKKLNAPGGVYVLGDNSEISIDSRDFGAIQKQEILGKVL
ncbi:MAG: signal peptidase I [Armatimonas sp.]